MALINFVEHHVHHGVVTGGAGGVVTVPDAPAAGVLMFAEPAAPAGGVAIFVDPDAPAAGVLMFVDAAAPAAGGVVFTDPAAPAETPARGTAGFGTLMLPRMLASGGEFRS
jgi:hypothetical protein